MSVLRMALLAAGVAVVAGCSASAAAHPPDPTLPLDAYSLGAEDRAQVLRARFMLTEECMRRAGLGFRFPAVEPVTDLHNVDYFGWLDPGQTEKSGYVPESRNPYERTGIPGYSVGDDEVPRYADSASDAASQDPRIPAAERAWSECMESRGFHYRNTGEAEGDPRWATTARDDEIVKPRGTRAEIDTAVADAQCRAETGYSDVRRTVYIEAQQRVVDRDRARLDVIRWLNEARLANSAKVLGSQRR